jgi:hypothetical protein
MNYSPQHAVTLKLPQLLRKHLLRDTGDGSLEIREPKHLAAEEMEQDHEVPSALEDADGPVDAGRGGIRRVRVVTHG